MGAGRRGGVRVASIAGVGGLLVIAGCSDLLGFDHSLGGGCLLTSDCPEPLVCTERVCTVECNEDRDCADKGGICSTGHQCVMKSGPSVNDASPIGADALVDAPAESTSDGAGDSGCGDATAEFDGCGACRSGCVADAAPDEMASTADCLCRAACLSSNCLEGGPGCQAAWYTPSGQGIPGPQQRASTFSPRELWGQQIHILKGGRLAALGMYAHVTANATKTSYYLSLYADTGGGYPSTRVWASDQSTITMGAEKQEVTVPCNSAVTVDATYYWIVGAWDAPVALDVSSGTVKWVHALLPSFEMPRDPFPTMSVDTSSLPQQVLDVYAVVLE